MTILSTSPSRILDYQNSSDSLNKFKAAVSDQIISFMRSPSNSDVVYRIQMSEENEEPLYVQIRLIFLENHYIEKIVTPDVSLKTFQDNAEKSYRNQCCFLSNRVRFSQIVRDVQAIAIKLGLGIIPFAAIDPFSNQSPLVEGKVSIQCQSKQYSIIDSFFNLMRSFKF